MFDKRKTNAANGYSRFADGLTIYDSDIARVVKERLNVLERLNILKVVSTAFDVFAEMQSKDV